jgi:hypothetical protein
MCALAFSKLASCIAVVALAASTAERADAMSAKAWFHSSLALSRVAWEALPVDLSVAARCCATWAWAVRPAAAWLAIAVGIVLVGMLLLRPAWRVVEAFPDPDSARRVGHLLMAKYMVAFEGAGFLILIGIFGAVLLARPSSYADDPSRSAKVAIDQKPEPIADDGLVALAGAGSHPEPHEHRRPPGHRA